MFCTTGISRARVPPLVWLVCGTLMPAFGGEPGPCAPDAEAMLRSAVRMRCIQTRAVSAREIHTLTGHGTAFGVDLSAHGLPGRRYLLSAAHTTGECLGGPDKAELWIEIREGRGVFWERCRLKAADRKLDVCLLESERDLSCLASLAAEGASAGEPVVMAGAPRGAQVALFRGLWGDQCRLPRTRALVQLPFDHGDSGGPLFHAVSGLVVGMAVAGVPKGDDLDPTRGLFVPLDALRAFLEQAAKGERAKATQTPIVPVIFAYPVSGAPAAPAQAALPRAEVVPLPAPSPPKGAQAPGEIRLCQPDVGSP